MSDILTEKIFEEEESQQQKERKAARKEELEKKRAKEAKARALAEKRGKLAKKYVLIGLGVLIVMLILFGRLILQIRTLAKEKAEKEAAINALNNQIEELESTLDRVTSPEYIEEEARSQLRMIYPDEVLYVVDDED